MPHMKLNTAAIIVMLAFFSCFVGVLFSEEADSEVNDLRLKDYRPESIYRISHTQVKHARFAAIDMHSHNYGKTPEGVDEWVKIMDQAGIAKSIILTKATGKEFDAIYKLYSNYPDRFDVWCGFDYTGYDKPGFGPAAIKELMRCYKVGAKGVGELGDKGKGLSYCKPSAYGMHPDDPRMDGLLEKCAELKMPVNIHIADPYWMYEPMDATNDGLMNAYHWRLDNQEGIVGHDGMLVILERTLKRHPKTTFVACHFANCTYDLNRLGHMFDQYPNLYADISGRFSETAAIPRFAGRFYEKYQDRLVYGTDMPMGRDVYELTFRVLETSDEHFYAWGHSGYHWPLYGLALNDDILKKVYRDNSLKILGAAK